MSVLECASELYMLTDVRAYSMTLATWISTGTLLSLNAVVMKQPNVRAAITLREKANRELALDRTVFIFNKRYSYKNTVNKRQYSWSSSSRQLATDLKSGELSFI